MPEYSDYIIYADESGDPNPASLDPNYPVFVLNFCVFRKSEYAASALPAVTAFKFRHFGHDDVVLHENEIRLQRPPFSFLRDGQKRDIFMAGLNGIIKNADFTMISAIVDKKRLSYRYALSSGVYELALSACMRRLNDFLADREEGEGITHLVIESRGKGGDREFKSAFDSIQSGHTAEGDATKRLVIRFADKKTNAAGLQIADLSARPIGRHFIDPEQINRAWDTLETKLFRSPQGISEGWGITALPK